MKTGNHDHQAEPGTPTDPVEEKVIAPLRRARLEPDDLQNARLFAAVDAALTRAPAPGAAPPPRQRRHPGARLLVPALALPAVAIAALLALTSGRKPHPIEPPAADRQPMAITAEADTAARRPYLVARTGTRVRARVGTNVRLTLIGPGEVFAFSSNGATELDLTSGRLLVDYEGAGALLRVRSPGAITTVVGTLFAVESRGLVSRVAVARGVVTVDGTVLRRQRVTAGRSWRTDAPETEDMPYTLATELAEHEAGVPYPIPDGVHRQAPAEPPAERAPSERARPRPALAARPPRVDRPRLPGGDVEAEYAAAEELMRTGANVEARRALRALVAAHPQNPRAEVALLDLARLAFAAGHPAEARGHLARLTGVTRDAALLELARQLEQRIGEKTP